MFNLPDGFYSSDQADSVPQPRMEELSLASSEAVSDNEDCDSVRNNFDIETLVDECFMSQYSGLSLSVQSWEREDNQQQTSARVSVKGNSNSANQVVFVSPKCVQNSSQFIKN